MSVKAISWAWDRIEAGDVKTPAEKLVLLRLADHANDENFKAWPSTRHIAKKTGLSRATVKASIDSLANHLIHVERRRRHDGSATSNSYFLRVDQDLAHPGQSSDRAGQSPDSVGQSSATPPEPPEKPHAIEPAAKGGGKRGPARSSREGLGFGEVFGLEWQRAWSRYVPEERAIGILNKEGIDDPQLARRIIAEWAAAGARGFRDDDPAAALVWACRNSKNLVHTAGGDERLPSWAQ